MGNFRETLMEKVTYKLSLEGDKLSCAEREVF